jgi:predicted nucleotidyltransferase component of viral defense system
MKDYLLDLVSQKEGFNAKLNCMREYLQAYTLRIMQEQGAFRSAAFLGGTALRFLHDLPRFSEDLDFSLVEANTLPFVRLLKKINDELALAGYKVTVSYNEKKAVQHAFLKFEELMYQTQISPLKSQKFSIKIEVDTRPPKGAVLETRVVNKYFPISFLCYDLSSLFAGKFHALLNRKYIKGRDFFDLGWYLSRWNDLSPNINLLTNALKQTGWKGKFPTQTDWRNFIHKIVEAADWGKVTRDVENFLERPSDLDIFSKKNILKLIQTITPTS